MLGMKTHLRKVADSIGLIIPATMARELLLTAGSEVDIELKAGASVLTPLKRGSKRLPYTGAQLMVETDAYVDTLIKLLSLWVRNRLINGRLCSRM